MPFLEAHVLVEGQGRALQHAGGEDDLAVPLVPCELKDSPDQGFCYPLVSVL